MTDVMFLTFVAVAAIALMYVAAAVLQGVV